MSEADDTPPGPDEPSSPAVALSGAIEALEALLEARKSALSEPPPGEARVGHHISDELANVPLLIDVVVPGDPKLAGHIEEDEDEAAPGEDDDAAEGRDEPLRQRLIAELEDIVDRGLERGLKEARRRILEEVRQHLDKTLSGPGGGVSGVATPAAPPRLGFHFELIDPGEAGTTPEPAAPPGSAFQPELIDVNHPETVAAAAPTAMEKTYDPRNIEQAWYVRWEAEGRFAPRGEGAPYCIMLPPPNVTGSLHMGHAFQDTLMDALIRYQRMRGRNALWQCGTDHAGIATQMVVERQLAEKGQTRQALGRERFTEEVWRWKAESGGNITRQLRRMGTTMDWSRERFTLDEGLSRAVTEVFVRLHEEGLVYRGKRLVNWDPVLHTAISDLEVISEEEQGQLWHIRYPLASGSGHVVVATTRPETLLGDAAVAVHPEDVRYRHLIGGRVMLPLTGRTIPVIADDYVDPSFGSGCLKITPAHDFNDYEVGTRHGLPRINIFTPDAKVNENGPAPYRGLDRYDARKQIVADLESQGLIERIEPHKLMVPRGDRSHAVIEPYLTDQWYVRIAPLAEPALRAVEEGRIRFVPDNWSKTYYEWMRNIQDWCISRQLWWGHRIPAWYDEHKRVYVGRSETEIRAREGLGPEVRLVQDEDVLDTWFSSALWPFSTLGWPEETPDLAKFYPTSVLVTGFDIIFFWVARMIMMGLKFMGEVPFREVYVHGLVRDAEGHKMSKSRGNVLDPIDLIDGIDLEALVAKRTAGLMRPQDAPKIEAATRRQFPDGIPGYGTDALRYTFASLATQGRDIRFDLGRVEGYRNFCNKLWNAARFVLTTVGDAAPGDGPVELGVPERWILSRLQHAARAVTEGYEHYRFDLAAQALYELLWDDYCDWYLELSKARLNDPGATEAARRGTRRTLLGVLETFLRLAHPIMPYITEELWQRVAPLAGVSGETIMLQPYPQSETAYMDEAATQQLEWVKTFILGLRRIRSEMNIPPGKPLPVLVRGGSNAERAWLADSRREIETLGRAASIAEAGDEAPEAATALAGGMTLLVPLADLIEPEAESKRLGKELDRLRGDRARVEAKLANDQFVERAPHEVVEKERARLAELGESIGLLEAQLARIESLR